MRIETHIHTHFSKDSLLCFWLLYLKCLRKHIDCVAITEHNNIDGGIRFKKYCERRGNRLNVIVGEEIFTDSGEIIGLFLTETISPGLSVADTIDEIKKQNGVVYLPHPYDEKREKTVLIESEIAKNRYLIDCVEIHNGRNISSAFGVEQEAIALKYTITPVIGSDAHTLMEVGRNYIEIDTDHVPQSSEEFIHCIKNAEFHKAECIRFAHKITKFAKLVKLIMRGKFNEIYRTIVKRITRGEH